MPMIKAAIETVFPGKTQFADPDLAIAKGAALAAAIEYNDYTTNVPKAFAEGSTVIDKLSRAFGTSAVMDTGETVLDNLLFDGDISPSEVTASYVIPDIYADKPKTTIFVDPVFESKLRRTDPLLTLKDAQGNPVENDPGLLLKEIGAISIEIPPYSPSDTILEYTICARGDGVHVTAKNLNTNEDFNAFIESANTKSPEELAEAAMRISLVKTRGD